MSCDLKFCGTTRVPVVEPLILRGAHPLAHRGQVVAPFTTGALIPNHRSAAIVTAKNFPLQGTKPGYVRAASCPGSEICDPQGRNRSAAFLLSCDFKFYGTTRIPVEGLLILGGGVRRWRGCRGGRRRRRRRQRRAGRRQRCPRSQGKAAAVRQLSRLPLRRLRHVHALGTAALAPTPLLTLTPTPLPPLG